MAKKGTNDDAVMKFVEKELGKNPGIQTADLQEKAKSVDASVGKLSLRQFNARYPLQVKRRAGLKNPGRGRRRGTGRRRGGAGAPANREAVREVFLSFAADMAAAEARKDLVRILAGVDRYVDEALKAARK